MSEENQTGGEQTLLNGLRWCKNDFETTLPGSDILPRKLFGVAHVPAMVGVDEVNRCQPEVLLLQPLDYILDTEAVGEKLYLCDVQD